MSKYRVKKFPFCNRGGGFVLAFLLLWTTTLVASPDLPELDFGPGLIDRLVEPSTRIEALREIVLAEDEAREKSDWKERSLDTFIGYHQDIALTRCPQPGDVPPLYLLTYRINFDAISSLRESEPQRHELLYPETAREREAIARLAGAAEVKKADEPSVFWEPPAEQLKDLVLIFLDGDGRIVRPLGRNDYLQDGIIHDVNRDRILERIESINFGVYDTRKGEPNIHVQVLEVHSLEMPARPLLRVVLNWHSYELDLSLRWDWELRDIDSDGIYEFVLGPPSEDGIEAKTVFRWDAKTSRYTGPPGGQDDRFINLELDSDRWDQLREIKESGGMSYAPAPLVSGKQAFFEREPYVHNSLAGLSDAELFTFMWGGKEEHPRGPPAPGTRARPGEKVFRKFEVPKGLSKLDPKAAALALAQGNRTEQHRNDFELFLLDDASPPQAEWVTASQESQLGLGAIRLEATSAPWWRTRFNMRPDPKLYPYGTFSHLWRHGELSAERAEWLAETLWWLTRLRSVPQRPEALEFKNELVRQDGFGSPPTEFGFRVLDSKGEALLDYPTGLPLRNCWQWVGPYDRQVCRTLAYALWENVLGDFKKSGNEVEPAEALRFFIDASGESFPNDVPALLLAQAVTAVGEAGDAEVLTSLEALARDMPPPGELELAWQAVEAEWEEVKIWNDQTSWKVWRARKDAFESASAKLTGNLAWHLRERLPRTMKQIRLAADNEALADYATQPGSDPAIWALRRLEEEKPEAAVAALEAVYFREVSKWRKRILNYRARTDMDAAKALYLALPAAERIPLMEDFFRNVAGEADGAEWIDPLLEAIGTKEVPNQTRVACSKLLVPRHKPLKYPDPKIAERLEAILKTELEQEPKEKNEPLLNELLRALASRNQTEDLFQYADTIWTRSEEERFESSVFFTLIHVAQLGLTKEQSESLWEHFDPSRSDVYAKRTNYVGYAYMANLRQAHDVIARLATRGPNEAEPLDNRRDRPLIKNGREHYARQLLAVWDEPDKMTRAKCLLVFGMQLGSVWFTNDYPGPDDIALNEIREYFEEMSAAERKTFEDLMTWLKEDPAVQERFGQKHYNSHFLYRVRKMMEPKE